MNEITRIHIAKTAYDIELTAKKELEKYLKNLETYTQDSEVFEDIEIRITELLAESGVKAGGVITSKEVTSIRTQLGEPHEFADEDGDIAVGAVSTEPSSRRLFRSTDNALLGGVLAGIATYLKVDAIWVRIIFVLLLLISFGLAVFAYILLWVVVPPARTAAEKLQLAGKQVTAASIKSLATEEEKSTPVLQVAFSIILGSFAALGAFLTLGTTLWLVIAGISGSEIITEATNGFLGLGAGLSWLVWLLFWIVVFGLTMLTALFSLAAYALFRRKLTKKILITGVAIIILGISSVATVVGVSSTQSMRIANETRSMVRETKANLPSEFANVTSVTFGGYTATTPDNEEFFNASPAIRYVVDNGPARYELNALPNARPNIKIEGNTATISVHAPNSYRNAFVQPLLTIYGPALTHISVPENENLTAQITYDGFTQDSLTVNPRHKTLNISGTYKTVIVTGVGYADFSAATIDELVVQSETDLSVNAGTVRTLTITQPTACPSGAANSTNVTVAGVTSGEITYNGEKIPARSYQTNCGEVVVNNGYESELEI